MVEKFGKRLWGWLSVGNRSLTVMRATALIWLVCLLWTLHGGGWWVVVLSACAVVVGMTAARHRRGVRGDDRRQPVASAVEREIADSLTDETLAWAVGTWRNRYL